MNLAIACFIYLNVLYRVLGSVAQIHRDESSLSIIANTNPLQRKHLKISGLEANLDFRITRNASGHVIEFKGVAAQMIEWLSFYLDFEYSALQVNVTPFDEIGNRNGLISYIIKGELDIAVAVSLTASRVPLVDFTHTSIYVPVSFMIPAPSFSIDFLSAIKPFQPLVWVTILVTLFAVMISLFVLSRFSRVMSDDSSINKSTDIIKRQNDKIPIYIFGLLLEQGGTIISNNMALRIVVSVWSIGSLIIVNHYDSLLTSYMTAPNPQPLVKSIYEIRTRPDLRVVVNKNLNLDILYSTADSGFMKEIGDRVRKFNESSRCAPLQQCVDLVKEGNTVYLAGREATLIFGVKSDLTTTGKCNVDLSKERFMNLKLAWAMKKKNPFTDIINKGIMRMREAGFVEKWYQENSPDVHKCINENTKKGPDPIEPLTIKHLVDAFIILFFGYSAAVLLFLIEQVSRLR